MCCALPVLRFTCAALYLCCAYAARKWHVICGSYSDVIQIMNVVIMVAHIRPA